MNANGESERTPQGWSPFRICLLADVEPRQEYSLRGPTSVFYRRVLRRTFDRFIEQVCPAYRLVVTDPLRGPDLEIDIRLSNSQDLGLNGLLRSPTLLHFLDALQAVETSPAQLGPLLSRLFGDRASVFQTIMQADERPDVPVRSTQSLGRQLPHHELLDNLLGLVDFPVLDNQHVAQSPTSREKNVEKARQYLCQSLATILNKLLAEPEYQRLNRVFRSIDALCDTHADSDWIEFYVLGGTGTQSQYKEALDRLEPDLLVLEAPVAACAREVERLAILSSWAEQRAVPVVATLDQDWFENKDAAPAQTPISNIRVTRAATRLLDVIGARTSARWLVLCANDVCDQEPVTRQLGHHAANSYTQPPDEPTSYTFLPAGVNVAQCCVRALLEKGSPFPDPNARESKTRSRAVRIIGNPDQTLAIGTHYYSTIEDARDLASLGLCCLVPTSNRDTVVPYSFPTAYRERSATGFLGAPTSTLSDQLLAGRLTRLLRSSKADSFDEPSRSRVCATLERRIDSLFPNAPPIGPEIAVSANNREIRVEIKPHRYERLELQSIQATIPWD